MDRIAAFIKQWCDNSRRVSRLTAAITRQVKYLSGCNARHSHPYEARYLVVQTYMLLAEIFALKNDGLIQS